MAMPSSPVPRTKLFVAVMLLPTELFSDTLLRLMPSAHTAVARLFSTRPPVPEAHQPDSECWFQMWLATQFVPEVSIAPPPPSTISRLVEFESVWKSCTVHDVSSNVAASGVELGSGTWR